MSTEDKSPTSPTNSDVSPKNTIRVIKTSNSDQTLVEVKVAGETDAKVTVFGGDVPKTESRTNGIVNNTEEKQPNDDTKAKNEKEKAELNETTETSKKGIVNNTEEKKPDEDTKAENKKDKAEVKETTETANKGEQKEQESDDNSRLEPLTKDEIDKILSKHSKMKDLDKYLEFFWSVDEYGFGLFTIHQFAYRLWQMGRRFSGREVAMMFADLDHDRDRLVSLDEFLDEMSKEKPKPKTDEEWRELFDRCDKNGDGYICKDDLAEVFKEKEVTCRETAVVLFLDRYSLGSDEMKLDFHRFRKALRHQDFF